MSDISQIYTKKKQKKVTTSSTVMNKLKEKDNTKEINKPIVNNVQT